MAFSSRAARAAERLRSRYGEEVERLIAAAARVMDRRGVAAATVADILTEAGLSTRAFYRHFESRDELLLAMYEHESDAVEARLEGALARARGARGRLDAWLDEMLDLVFDPRRGARTRLLQAAAGRISAERPDVIAGIVERQVARLARLLEEGRREGVFPRVRADEDARAIHAVVWNLTDPRYAAGGMPERGAARRRVLRFVLPALGVGDSARARRRRER